jgi:hypothetical protein
VKRLARAVYSRASENRALRRPLDAIRSHPRVRAFARRHVQVLLSPGTSWANVDGALRLLAEDPSRRVAFGPWEGDALTELLYWDPFVCWAQEHFGLTPAADGAAFPSTPVRALVEQYRSGNAAPRPLLKRARYDRLPTQPPDVQRSVAAGAAGLVAPWSRLALLGVLSGVPTIAIRPADGAVEPDLDLAQRVAAELGTSLTVVDAAALERLEHALH